MNRLITVLGVLIVVGFIGSQCVFTVKQTEQAIKLKFGRIEKADYSPGLHFMIPVVNSVRFFDRRIHTLRTQPERFLTSEKKNVKVDAFVTWRIRDVATYYTRVRGDVSQANIRLEQIIKDELRSEFGKRTIRDLVSSDRKAIRDLLVKNAEPTAENLGLLLVDVRIKRIDLPDEVSSSVYRRMESERARIAREFRSHGAESAERIRADADKQSEVILANAYRQAEAERGAGDAAAAAIFSQAAGRNQEFFAFYRSLAAYQKSFAAPGDSILVVEPTSDFFQYFTKDRAPR